MLTTSSLTARHIVFIFAGFVFACILLAGTHASSYVPSFIPSHFPFSSSSTIKTDTSHPCLQSIQAQRSILLENYREALSGVTHVAFVDYPDYANKGDSAIYLGEMAILDALGIEVRYICTWDSTHSGGYDKAGLDESLSDVPHENTAIMLSGGGNLGDIYWILTDLKNRVVKENPDRKIRSFPQTIHFKHQDKLEITQAIFGNHPDFEVVGRDTITYEKMVAYFPRNRIRLTPDIAFMIGYDPQYRLTPRQFQSNQPATLNSVAWPARTLTDPVRDITVMSREDHEGGQDHSAYDWEAALAPHKVQVSDWLKNGPDLSPSDHLDQRQITYSKDGTLDWKRWWDMRALLRVEWALEYLSSGTFLVADRLHAHILSTLLGVGHVLIESGEYQKIARYQNTWLEGCLVSPDEEEQGLSDVEDRSSMEGRMLKGGRKTDGLVRLVNSEEQVVDLVKKWFKLADMGVDLSRT